MPFYMTQASYTPETWKAMMANPQDRVPIMRELAEAAGGRLLHYFYSFGEYDVVNITEMPDNVTATSAIVAVAGSGALAKVKTTVLMTVDEGLEAFRRAGEVAYRPPGS